MRAQLILLAAWAVAVLAGAVAWSSTRPRSTVGWKYTQVLPTRPVPTTPFGPGSVLTSLSPAPVAAYEDV
jgi:hypothetical protein